MIPIYVQLGRQLELMGVKIVENASAEEIGRIFIEMSKLVEALSNVPPVLSTEGSKAILNECTQTLCKAAHFMREAGVSLGAKLNEDVDKKMGKSKGWMKNGV